MVPDEVPVMTLPDVAFFPQALMPLHIFEPRYRRMLRQVLATNRLFAVAGLDAASNLEGAAFEPPHRIATLGIVRACQKTDNGTSTLLLQGLCRVEITDILNDFPYRSIRIRALRSEPGEDPEEQVGLRRELGRLLALKLRYGANVPEEMADFLRSIDDPETFVDLAAYSLCDDAAFKQKLLETLDVTTRLKLYKRRLSNEIRTLRLRHSLPDQPPDDKIDLN